MPFAKQPHPETLVSLANATPRPFWLDTPDRPEPTPALTTTITADLAIIGAGFTGLWTALLAKEQQPDRDVVLIEADECASGATGRNGGFVAASITHGFENGFSRWPNEMKQLIAVGQANLNAIGDTVTLLFTGFLGVMAVRYLIHMKVGGDYHAPSDLSAWIAVVPIGFGFTMMVVRFSIRIAAAVGAWRRREPAPELAPELH